MRTYNGESRINIKIRQPKIEVKPLICVNCGDIVGYYDTEVTLNRTILPMYISG